MKAIALCAVVLLLLLVAIPSKTQDQPAPIHDANGYFICRGWNRLQRSEKLIYVLGYAEGLAIAAAALREREPQRTFQDQWSSMWPVTLTNGEIANRIDSYCAVHEPDQVGTAISEVAQQLRGSQK